MTAATQTRNLTRKTVIVTGASSGIGEATALLFAERGWNVVLAARRRDALEGVATRCRKLGTRTLAVVTDVTRPEDCELLVQTALSDFSAVDLLVNNAGFAIFDPISSSSTDDLASMMQTNYLGAVHCTKAVLPHMMLRHQGAIVNVGSISGIMGYAGMGGYCASKFALTGFTEALRNEVVSSGIRVSLVCPGTTATPFFVTADKGKMPQASRLVLAISPDRVARAIFRAQKRGSYRIIIPFTAAAFMKLKELFPRTAHLLMRVVSELFLRGKA